MVMSLRTILVMGLTCLGSVVGSVHVVYPLYKPSIIEKILVPCHGP